ncbi:FtsB family cell division protein [Arthrobacter sp. UM1]|uniref:FtsB family cell division protein n=1 Tax=Arthrobacter sp. UM1 TaxID=2766776 RepID=UPI001CF67958|nr:septum formation initiator family protein [Arthrobacter sp. UM1]MCB4207941.1 septum formation initiator family protein [Arthrobacter sp. UM1]
MSPRRPRSGSPLSRQLEAAARRRAERTALAPTIRRSPSGSGSSRDAEHSTPSRKGPHRGALTGPLLVVIIFVIGAMMLIAPQLKVYMKQKQEVAELKADIAAKKAENERLTSESKRFEDDAYVRQQARDRLFMVMPGETRYIVTGRLPGSGEAVQGSAASHTRLSWHEGYTDAIRQAAR